MPIFKEVSKGQLKKLKSYSASKEKDVQKLVEDNLFEVLDMYFLDTEYTTTFGGRIDTIAIDINGSPVIIEYKKNRSDNIINQGLSYLRWLKEQKVEFFEMLIQKKLGSDIASSIKIDWKNPRVVCIAEAYSKFDVDTVEVIPMRIELFKYRYYDNGIFSLDPLNVSEQTSASRIKKDDSNNSDTVDHSIEGHLEKANAKIKSLFNELRSKIIELDENIIEKATALYVAYRVSKNFAEVTVGKSHLKIHLRPAEFNDPKNMVEKIPEGYNWTMNRRIYLKDEKDLEYVFSIIEQSYQEVL